MLVSKEYYRTTWRGEESTYDDADLERALTIAEDMVSFETTADVSKMTSNEYIKKAICAQAETLMRNGIDQIYADDKIISSSTNGFSYTLKLANENSTSKLCEMTKGYMGKAGLSYRGTRLGCIDYD